MSTSITIISQASKDPGASIVGEEIIHHNYGDAGNSSPKSYKKWARIGIMVAVALMIALAIAIGVNNGQRGNGTPPTLSATQVGSEEVTPPQIIQKDENPQLVVDSPKPAPLPQQQQATWAPTSALTNGATVTVSIETTAPPTISDRSSSEGDRRMIQSPTWNG